LIALPAGLLSGAPLLVNGDFSGGLTGWTVGNNPVNSLDTAAAFVVSSGVARNTASTGPNARVLYQDFAVPTNLVSASLSFERFSDSSTNLNTVRTDIETVPFSSAFDAFRIDIVGTSDLYYGAVLFNVFTEATNSGGIGPGMLMPVTVNSAALTAFLQARGGETLRFRISQVESSYSWNVGIDNLALDGEAVPEPSTLGLAAMGLLSAAVLRRRWRV
jgi:hypothetical protein